MMLIDFATLPPEVNSGWMYSGPGSGPMLAAATAWAGLAAELASAASSYHGVISRLTNDVWRGPAAMSMSASAGPYADWTAATAELAEQAATKARSAAAAYDEAFAMIVPPPVIAANRSLLASLVATNIVGQNTPMIALTEAHYAEMWAQDAAAMYGYAGNSAGATSLTPFTGPSANTNPAGQGDEAAAVGAAGADNAASQIPNVLQALGAGPVQATGPLSQTLIDIFTSPLVVQFDTLFNNLSPVSSIFSGTAVWGSAGLFGIVPLISAWVSQIQSALGAAAAAQAASVVSDVSGGLGSTLVNFPGAATGWGSGGSGGPVGLGRAASIGGLSVPPTWDTSKVRLASLAVPSTGGAAEAGGFYGGVPPIGSVVNAPGSPEPRVKGVRSNPVPQLTGSATAQQGTYSADSTTAPDEERRISERDELEGLRKAVSEVSAQTDMLQEQAALLLKKAMER